MDGVELEQVRAGRGVAGGLVDQGELELGPSGCRAQCQPAHPAEPVDANAGHGRAPACRSSSSRTSAWTRSGDVVAHLAHLLDRHALGIP